MPQLIPPRALTDNPATHHARSNPHAPVPRLYGQDCAHRLHAALGARLAEQLHRPRPRVLTDGHYAYRVRVDDTDLGVVRLYAVAADGSQTVNLLEYNKGYGVEQARKIRVYVVDAETQNEYLVAQWN
ncbi:fungal immunomodulatory protein Fve-domain-containing protein [Lenzites betulinus]|nr:fungal immunomodulatory protein Fve-domain-containing protein [Lenzites betulinus]